MSDSESDDRTRLVGEGDESDDESNSNDDVPGKATKQETAADQAAPATEESTKKRRTPRRPAFSENNLVMEKGLVKIYRDFPKKCQYKGRGREAEFLRGLMLAYKEWGHQLYPALAFEDLANRTEKLGGKARVRELMGELREQERDRFIESKYGSSAVEEVRGQEAAKSTGENVGGVDEQEGERHDLPRNGRYMDVSEDQDRAQQTVGSGGNGGDSRDTAASTSRSATVLSPEIRERMEANRRLALERLRLKKQEAVTAAAAAEAATPASDSRPEGAALNDATTESRNRESNDATDMEEEAHSPAKRARITTGDATLPQPSAATSPHPIPDAALSSRDAPVSASMSQEKERGSLDRSSSSGERIPGATVATQGPIDKGAEQTRDARASTGEEGRIGEEDNGSLRRPPRSSTEEHGDVAAADRDAPGALVGRDGEEGVTSNASPRRPTPTHQGGAAAGGVAPLSPLGRMLAATDEAAEGQSMGTRLPVGDLFPGET